MLGVSTPCPAFGWAPCVNLHQKEPNMPPLQPQTTATLQVGGAHRPVWTVGGWKGWFSWQLFRARWFWGGWWFRYIRDPPKMKAGIVTCGKFAIWGPQTTGAPNHQLIWWSFETKLIFRCFGISMKAFFKRCIFRWWIPWFIFVSRTGKSKLRYVMFFKSLTNLESPLKMI